MTGMGARVRRLFDWRMVASIAFLLLVVLVLVNFFHAVNQDNAKANRIDQLVAEAAEQDRAAAASRETSSAERERLLRQQAKLLRQTATLQKRFVTLVAFLDRAGVEVPPGLFPDPTTSASPSPGPASNRAVTPEVGPTQQPAAPQPQPSSAASDPAPVAPTPTPSASPTPDPTPPPVLSVPPVCVLGLCL